MRAITSDPMPSDLFADFCRCMAAVIPNDLPNERKAGTGDVVYQNGYAFFIGPEISRSEYIAIVREKAANPAWSKPPLDARFYEVSTD